MSCWTYLKPYSKQNHRQFKVGLHSFSGLEYNTIQYNTISGKPSLHPIQSVGNTKWQFITQIQNYNSVGMAIEEQDALNRFSMALYGYGRNLQIAGSNNSQYRETGFDGFEDYGFGDCEDDHMSWRAFKNNVTNTQSHTGRNSIKVSQNEKLKISKVIVPCPADTILH